MPMVRRAWKLVLLGLATGIAVMVMAAPLLMRFNFVRSYVGKGVNSSNAWSARTEFGLRQGRMRGRAQALQRGELQRAAQIHVDLAQEGLLRARAVFAAWMTQRHPKTKLFPESTTDRQWNYLNSAADFFVFQPH